MKEAIKSKKGTLAIVSIIIALFAAIWQNGGLDGIIIDVPGSDPIEVSIPESCEDCEEDCKCDIDDCACPVCAPESCEDCEEACKCDIDDGDCVCDTDCACPVCA